MKGLSNILKRFAVIALLPVILASAGVPSAAAQSADSLQRQFLKADITNTLFLCTDIAPTLPPATPLLANPPQWRYSPKAAMLPQDRSEQFKATQLILPLSLVAVSSFGTWDKQAKCVNTNIREGFQSWRGEHRMHFDDYVQYLPAASYLLLGFTGTRSRHNFKERLIVLGTSYAAMGIMTNAIKYTVREPRPGNVDERNSYPSGHTATAFMGAELVRREYGAGYGIAAYTIACGIGFMRMYNNRHWLNDVLAGAGIGILSAEIGYWLLPYTRRLFGMDRRRQGGVNSFVVTPFYDSQTNAAGAGAAISF